MSIGISTLAWTRLGCASLGIIQLMSSQFSPSFHWLLMWKTNSAAPWQHQHPGFQSGLSRSKPKPKPWSQVDKSETKTTHRTRSLWRVRIGPLGFLPRPELSLAEEQVLKKHIWLNNKLWTNPFEAWLKEGYLRMIPLYTFIPVISQWGHCNSTGYLDDTPIISQEYPIAVGFNNPHGTDHSWLPGIVGAFKWTPLKPIEVSHERCWNMARPNAQIQTYTNMIFQGHC